MSVSLIMSVNLLISNYLYLTFTFLNVIVIGKTPSPPGQAATAYANDRQVEQGVDKVAAKLGSSLSMKGA